MHPLNAVGQLGVDRSEGDLDIDKVVSDLDIHSGRRTYVRQHYLCGEMKKGRRTKVQSVQDLAASMTQSPSYAARQ